MRYFLTGRLPKVTSILLVESGTRGLLEGLIPGLRQGWGEAIPIDLFTPIFAISRVAGWTAHVMEQLMDNRIMRPDSIYVGPKDQKYVPVDKR